MNTYIYSYIHHQYIYSYIHSYIHTYIRLHIHSHMHAYVQYVKYDSMYACSTVCVYYNCTVIEQYVIRLNRLLRFFVTRGEIECTVCLVFTNVPMNCALVCINA